MIIEIKNKSVKVGLAIKPETDISILYNLVNYVDFVLVMTVNPGFGNQLFIMRTLPKIKKLREKYPKLPIQVDGGINKDTIKLVRKAGANIIVSGSFIFCQKTKNKP